MYKNSAVYYKNKRKVSTQIISYTIQCILMLLIFCFFAKASSLNNWTPLIIIPYFYLIFLQGYIRQFRYYLRITDESIRVSNDRSTPSEEFFWSDVKEIIYTKKGMKVKNLAGQVIEVYHDVENYQQAWNEIVQYLNGKIIIPDEFKTI